MTERSERGAGKEARAFSRPISVDDVPDEGMRTVIEATPDECRRVAAEIDVPAVLGLSAEISVSRLQDGRFHVGGDVKGRVTQICVVTLEPFDSDVAHEIDISFAPVPRSAAASAPPARSRRGPPPKPDDAPKHTAAEADVDAPDPLLDGRIDLGVVAEEFLTLALDFYPRKPGVAFNDVVGGEGEREPSVFAALERFKDRS